MVVWARWVGLRVGDANFVTVVVDSGTVEHWTAFTAREVVDVTIVMALASMFTIPTHLLRNVASFYEIALCLYNSLFFI